MRFGSYRGSGGVVVVVVRPEPETGSVWVREDPSRGGGCCCSRASASPEYPEEAWIRQAEGAKGQRERANEQLTLEGGGGGSEGGR